MSTAEDIEAAYGIDNHDLLSMTSPSPSSTTAADPSATATSSTSDLASLTPTSPTTAPTDPAASTTTARPRIVRGRGNRLFGVLQSTLARANEDLAKDQQKISARIQIQDRVRHQNQQAQAKLTALHSLRTTRARLERDLADMNRRVVDVQMQIEMPGAHLRIEGAPKHPAGPGRGGPYARPVILWRPGRHNERTRRGLEAQQEERKSGLEASLAMAKARVEKVKEELAEVARREREVELEDNKSPVFPTDKVAGDERKDVEMGEAGEQRAEPESNSEQQGQEVSEDRD